MLYPSEHLPSSTCTTTQTPAKSCQTDGHSLLLVAPRLTLRTTAPAPFTRRGTQPSPLWPASTGMSVGAWLAGWLAGWLEWGGIFVCKVMNTPWSPWLRVSACVCVCSHCCYSLRIFREMCALSLCASVDVLAKPLAPCTEGCAFLDGSHRVVHPCVCGCCWHAGVPGQWAADVGAKFNLLGNAVRRLPFAMPFLWVLPAKLNPLHETVHPAW